MVARIGNVWKAEARWTAAIDPWRAVADASDDEARSLLRAARTPMQSSADRGMLDRDRHIYRRVGRPCPRCGTAIQSQEQGDDNRATYWWPECQR